MKENTQILNTLSNLSRTDNDMSAVPLMTLHNAKRGVDENHDSDQMSDEEDDPLESVLARMKYRTQSYRSQDFWSSVMFTGVLCFVVGFVIGYILFLSIDKNNRILQAAEHDADPKVASALLQEISARGIKNFFSVLNVTPKNDLAQDLLRAQKVRQYFHDWGFDTVSEVIPSETTLSFYDTRRPNTVTIIKEKKEMDKILYGLTEHNYLIDSAVLYEEGCPVQTQIQGTVVYVNFGRESDFQYLKEKRSDVGVNKNIALARIGKVHLVELVCRCLEKGAAGVILFADPQQYPNNVYKNRTFLSPSDLGKLQSMNGHACGLSTDECIPVQTISANDAEYLFREMSSSEETPESWRGNMSTTYPIGVGFSENNSKLRMEVSMINMKKTYYSVTGGLRGSHEPDRYIILGSSHSSGSEKNTLGAAASMMEVARVLYKLNSDTGWRPRRSIIFCSWGFSSIEDTVISIPLNEDWLHSLHEKAVVYLGMEVANKGNRSLNVAVTPLLSEAVYDASSLVPNPSLKATASALLNEYDSWLKSVPSFTDPKKPRIHNVGESGVFQSVLKDLGIPSVDFHLGGKESEDSNFRYHTALAQLWAILTWKMSDSPLVPFDVNQYAAFLQDSLKVINATHKKEVETYALSTFKLESAVHNFSVIAKTFQNKMHHLDKSDSLTMRIMNDQQTHLERTFLHHYKNTSILNSRQVMFSSGASVERYSSAFEELQDMLDDLSSTPIPTVVKNEVENCIKSLIHCITTAAHSLQVPFQPPVLIV